MCGRGFRLWSCDCGAGVRSDGKEGGGKSEGMVWLVCL